MTDEIIKLYENCKIKKQYCGWLDMGDLDTQYKYIRCDSLEEWKEAALMSRTREKDWDKPSAEYPPFTAEKQLELIKWLGIRDEFNFYQNKVTKDWVFYDHEKDATHYNFELGLASWVNYLWQDLTEEERKQIKEILE